MGLVAEPSDDLLLVPRPRGARGRSPAVVDLDLDPAQRAAVTLPRERALLVLGEAGHGKTTVAVHRVAHLFRLPEAPGRAAVVVPAEGLARLLQSLLRRLGADVEVRTYDLWAAAQARRAFRDVPRRECELTPPSVARVKRDPALRAVLVEIARREPGTIDDDRDAPRVRTRALVRRADLQHLFGDRVLLERARAGSTSLTQRMIDDTLEHNRVQFSLTAEQEWAHVDDPARLRAVDGLRLDEATATADAGTIDVEDYAVLFEIERLRAERRGRLPRAPLPFDLLMLDEAQELAPLELALLGRSLAPGGSLVVAGDADQQTDTTSTFGGWDAAMRELGCAAWDTALLDVGYRCPPELARLAHRILGTPMRAAATSAAPEGAPPVRLGFDDEPALAARLLREIRFIQWRDPRASIAVLCRAPLTARRIAIELRREIPARVVFDGHFLPRGPVQVTTVEETKGLEFDFVVVPDATARDYPDTPAARRALYVAVTRARHQVLLAHVGERSPLLASMR